ncbi:MAG: ribonuclease HII [Gemmatimonadetes bacterium]|nr:ribonuclease HII [Gemmatimonadota bacterium]
MAGGWSALERSLRTAGASHIAGVDEVGRGPLAGPVVVCAVIMPADRRAIAGVTDSKQLKAAERERLAAQIHAEAVAVVLAAASVAEIARWNIYQATARAMARAIARLAVRPDEVLVDGKPIKTLGVPHHAVVGGDATCYTIGCASIVAKVVRDRLMQRLAARHPGYGWDSNAGYGTPAHIAGLRERGLTAHHRVAFCRTALGGQLEL